METLVAHLLAVAEREPEKIALCCGSEVVRYREFRRRIFATASQLRQLGVQQGDRVLLCGGNTVAIPVLYFAIHTLGAIAAPVPPDTPEAVLSGLALDADARMALVDKTVSGMPCDIVPLASLSAHAMADVEIDPVCGPDDVADLLYTTGTTGKKKGVVLTQANILAAARNITQFIGSSAEDVEVVPLPLSHSFGLGRLRCMAIAGNTLILEPGVGTGAPVMKRILDVRATGLALVPAGFDILRRMTGDTLGQAKDHLKYIEIGSAPMKPETRQWLTDLLPNTRICHHYGLTEASRAAFTEFHSDVQKRGTAGRAAPNVEISVCDENGKKLPAGESGEVVVHGRMVMREYWKNPELTRQAFYGDSLRTGDIGYLDADGYLFLLGRRNDLINVGGRKVAPDEIEDLLRGFQGVSDVACVGEPHPLLGECVKAYVVADRDIRQGEIVSFLRPRVEEHKIPQMVERIDLIPRTSSGKIQRQMLRKEKKEAAWTSAR